MIVGIDLGTTNSVVAIWRDGEAVLVPNSLGHLLTPSAVSLSDTGTLLVGLAARERQSTHPKQTATTFKRLMGTSKRLALGKRQFTPEELSALVLRSLKADVEAFTGSEVSGAVITVPAYFNDKQRRATRRAGELAGLKVERLINEPTAAALAFGLHERDQEEPFLVFDLGGGTFDVSLVEMFEGIIEVRASAGDNRLGGEDFNRVVVDHTREQLGAELDPGKDEDRLAEVLREAAERARRALTESDESELRFVWKHREFQVPLSTETFAQLTEPLIKRLREPVLRSLRDGKTRVDSLAEIVLVGGSTRMPVVRKAVARLFGRFPNATVDPDHAVALGAAVQAGLRQRDAALDEVRLTDVCPFTLGVEVSERDGRGGHRDGIFSPIIERNTMIPASRVERYFTMADNQEKLLLKVYQGESRDVEANVYLGELDIAVPRLPAGEVGVDCRFTYDTSGLLEIDVSVPGTEIAEQLLIYDHDDELLARNLDARREALAGLKVHPRETAANAAALARAERCYEGYLGEMRHYIGGLIGQFEDALASQDDRRIDPARAELLSQLDQIEGDSYL